MAREGLEEGTGKKKSRKDSQGVFLMKWIKRGLAGNKVCSTDQKIRQGQKKGRRGVLQACQLLNGGGREVLFRGNRNNGMRGKNLSTIHGLEDGSVWGGKME